jgi:hypothetical protein
MARIEARRSNWGSEPWSHCSSGPPGEMRNSEGSYSSSDTPYGQNRARLLMSRLPSNLLLQELLLCLPLRRCDTNQNILFIMREREATTIGTGKCDEMCEAIVGFPEMLLMLGRLESAQSFRAALWIHDSRARNEPRRSNWVSEPWSHCSSGPPCENAELNTSSSFGYVLRT